MDAWALPERFVLSVRAPNGRKPTSHGLVPDGIFRIAGAGAPWRDLPGELAKWSSGYRQIRRWALAGLWEQPPEALTDSRIAPDAPEVGPTPQ